MIPTKWLWAWCVAQTVSHTYSFLVYGLIGGYPDALVSMTEALGYAFLADLAKGDEK